MELNQLAQHIGAGVGDLSFSIQLGDDTALAARDFTLTVAHSSAITRITAQRDSLNIVWTFEAWQDGYWVTLLVESVTRLHCRSLTSLSLSYAPDSAGVGQYWVPNVGKDVYTPGLYRVDEIGDHNRADKLIRGAFADDHNPGLFLGTRIPQTHEHEYTLRRVGEALQFDCTTVFSKGTSVGTRFVSEATWICASKTALMAQAVYASHLPYTSVRSVDIPVGWNSWDYYASSVGLDDVIENMECIQHNPALAARVKYMVVDMGWEHMLGEWQPNYRFPGGLVRLVSEITSRGFVPGIWTAPTIVQNPSRTAQCHPEMLLKNDYGDPIFSERFPNSHVLDPTHPEGEAFLRELYTRLYQTGFRLFKVDYAYEFSAQHNYFRRDYGCYDVWRHLFRLIRECVQESHIIGCGLPVECGPGLVESNRIGVDIHNHWSHVEWVCDFLQLSYWQHGRIAISDPDFLIVRGQHTSLETNTNRLNTNAHNPNYNGRWRRGSTFTLAEAQTWASMVMLTGGSLFLGDRLSQLNDVGQRLVERACVPLGVAARPLDLGAERRAGLWLQELATEYRLTLINWADTPMTRTIVFEALGVATPEGVSEFWTEQYLTVQQGCCAVDLPAHASAVLVWSKIR